MQRGLLEGVAVGVSRMVFAPPPGPQPPRPQPPSLDCTLGAMMRGKRVCGVHRSTASRQPSVMVREVEVAQLRALTFTPPRVTHTMSRFEYLAPGQHASACISVRQHRGEAKGREGVGGGAYELLSVPTACATWQVRAARQEVRGRGEESEGGVRED